MRDTQKRAQQEAADRARREEMIQRIGAQITRDATEIRKEKDERGKQEKERKIKQLREEKEKQKKEREEKKKE